MDYLQGLFLYMQWKIDGWLGRRRMIRVGDVLGTVTKRSVTGNILAFECYSVFLNPGDTVSFGEVTQAEADVVHGSMGIQRGAVHAWQEEEQFGRQSG